MCMCNVSSCAWLILDHITTNVHAGLSEEDPSMWVLRRVRDRCLRPAVKGRSVNGDLTATCGPATKGSVAGCLGGLACRRHSDVGEGSREYGEEQSGAEETTGGCCGRRKQTEDREGSEVMVSCSVGGKACDRCQSVRCKWWKSVGTRIYLIFINLGSFVSTLPAVMFVTSISLHSKCITDGINH
jgi:hypothetical protein